jgi:uncharacterized protein YhbP (UPF0306 family)
VGLDEECEGEGKVVREDREGAGARMREVYEFLQGESTLVLSTKGGDGAVHATPLYYTVAENLDLMWLSSRESAHSEALLVEPRAAVAVFHSTFEWREIAGVQMHGVCSTVEGGERSAIVDVYRARFQLGTVLSLAVSMSVVYRFRPRWIRMMDNRERFGYKFEMEL